MSETTRLRNLDNLARYRQRRDALRHRWLHDWVRPVRAYDARTAYGIGAGLVLAYMLAQVARFVWGML